VQRLQVKLIRGLGRHELHRRPLHRLGDCLRVVEVVLLSLRIGANVLRRHQWGIVAKTIELATEMMQKTAPAACRDGVALRLGTSVVAFQWQL
jgi:hypothetical protein